MKLDIFGDGISYVTDEVSTIPTRLANLHEENRIKFVTDLAAISRGKSESKNPAKRYEALQTEAAMSTASRPLEFLPVILRVKEFIDDSNGNLMYGLVLKDNQEWYITQEEFLNDIMRYSYYKDSWLYTNMRALINAGIPYSKIPYVGVETQELYKQFKAIKLKIPMFIWSQWPMTHTRLSKESQSDRVASQSDYWFPKDFKQRFKSYVSRHRSLDLIDDQGNPCVILYTLQDTFETLEDEKDFNNTVKDDLLDYYCQSDVQLILKTLGYKQEIWSRAPYYFKYKEVVVTGWYNDPTTWKHSFIERNCEPELWKNWTQKETQQVLEKVKEVIENEITF